MKIDQTLGNNVCVKMDPENNFIVTPGGLKLYVDTSFEPEKHIVRIGTVKKAPKRLVQRKGTMPWETEMELQEGDRVALYFLAVQNCLSPERKHYIKNFDDVYIFIKYHNIYAVIRDDDIIPVNGYLLVEPMEDPAWIRMKSKAEEKGLEIPDMRGLSNVNVVYGKIAYAGKPNKSYNSPYKSDNQIDVKVSDEVVMKRITDIPVEYEYHTKLDGGRKLYRVQRHQILAKL